MHSRYCSLQVNTFCWLCMNHNGRLIRVFLGVLSSAESRFYLAMVFMFPIHEISFSLIFFFCVIYFILIYNQLAYKNWKTTHELYIIMVALSKRSSQNIPIQLKWVFFWRWCILCNSVGWISFWWQQQFIWYGNGCTYWSKMG